MSLGRIFSGCALVLIAAGAADAQPARVELGLFGAYNTFADSLGLDNGYAGGTRIGLFVLSRFALEGSIGVGTTSFSVPASPLELDAYVPIRARLLYNQPLFGRTYLIAGGEYVNNRYIINSVSTSMHGWGGVLGLRLGLSKGFALRMDGTADYLPDVADLGGSAWNYGVEAGFSFMIGGSDSRGGGDDLDEWSRSEPVPSNEITTADAGPDGEAAAGEKAEAGSNTDAAPVALAAPAATAETAENTRTERDSDGDGVRDAVDRCPTTPAGTTVDTAGCAPLPLITVDAAQPTTTDDAANRSAPSSAAIPEGVLTGVTFRPGWWALDAAGQSALDAVLASLLVDRSVTVEIIGHTDNTGSTQRNDWLSWYRAEAVKLYLTDRGIARNRILTKGYGSDRPIASNETAAGRAKNRRIEIRIVE